MNDPLPIINSISTGINKEINDDMVRQLRRVIPGNQAYKRQWCYNDEPIPWTRVEQYARTHFQYLMDEYHNGLFPYTTQVAEYRQEMQL